MKEKLIRYLLKRRIRYCEQRTYINSNLLTAIYAAIWYKIVSVKYSGGCYKIKVNINKCASRTDIDDEWVQWSDRHHDIVRDNSTIKEWVKEDVQALVTKYFGSVKIRVVFTYDYLEDQIEALRYTGSVSQANI